MHDAYTIGVPVLVILIANFINRSELKEFRTEINARFDKTDNRIERLETKMDARFDAVHRDLQEFYRDLGHFEGRIDAIEKRP